MNQQTADCSVVGCAGCSVVVVGSSVDAVVDRAVTSVTHVVLVTCGRCYLHRLDGIHSWVGLHHLYYSDNLGQMMQQTE